MSREL
jgi:hypothetical protein